MASGTPHVGDVWWASCGSIQGMTGNTAAEGAVIKLVMGDNIDYFRPAAGFTLCEMLGSRNRHMVERHGNVVHTRVFSRW